MDLTVAAVGTRMPAWVQDAWTEYARRFPRMNVDPIVAAAGQLLMSSLVLIVLALTFEAPSQLLQSSTSVWMAVIFMAVFSTALAYILYFRLLATAGATNAILVTLLIPVTAVLLGTIILDERLQWGHFLGMIVIGLGLFVLTWVDLPETNPHLGKGFRAHFRSYPELPISMPASWTLPTTWTRRILTAEDGLARAVPA